MIDLRTLNNTLWLCEPMRLQQLALQVLSYPTCPTAREIAQARREELELAQRAAADALPSTGVSLADDLTQRGAGPAIRAVKGRVGIVRLQGPLEQRMSSRLMKAGGTSTEYAGLALDTLLNDPQVGAIVLHVDSPGGDIFGTEELADKVYNARDRKPIYAAVNSMMASAAYWIGTAAGTVVATPGGMAGSVGVYMAHVDESAAAAAEGMKVTFVSAGKFKVEGNPYEPLGDEARGYFQGMVDETYGKFVDALKRNRGVSAQDVRSKFGQGRLLGAGPALDAKMIDRVMTFEELMGRLTGGASGGSSGQSGMVSTKMLRLRHAWAKLHMGP